MRSAWLKWARAVEHQRVLARAMREFSSVRSYEYVCTDNCLDAADPLIRVHWRLVVHQPYPERWSLLLGDILANFRAALDHAFWCSVIAHSGPPRRPQGVAFPIATTSAAFRRHAGDLEALVASQVWEVVDAVQPFHGAEQAHLAPVEALRWLSNVDKHRFVHVIGRTVYDMGPTLVRSLTPIDVVSEWRREGIAEDGAVVARLMLRRPTTSHPVDLVPTFAHIASAQISEEPAEYRSLASLMDVIKDDILAILVQLADRLGVPYPDPDDFELGEEHEAYAADAGGNIVILPSETV